MLEWNRLALYKCFECVSLYSFTLKLPASLQIHPVHHSSLLDMAEEDQLPWQLLEAPPLVEVDGKHDYQVEWVEDFCVYRNQLLYFVHWMGYNQMTG
jgi:hypothetical protein